MKRILVVVDMQNDFVTGALGSEAARAVVEPIARRLDEHRRKGWPVLYTADTHTQEEYDGAISQESVRIPRHCVKGEPGWEIVDALTPRDGEPVVEKDSFGSVNLPDYIGRLDPEDAIALCGLCTDICVASNALHLRACYPNHPIAVLESLCAGTSAEAHEAALTVMGSCLIDVE